MERVKDEVISQHNAGLLDPEPGEDAYAFMQRLGEQEKQEAAATPVAAPSISVEEEEPVEIRKPSPWSYTRLSKFDICPASYRNTYILHMKPPQAPGALYGIILHEYAAEILARKAGIDFQPKSLAQVISDAGVVDWMQESLNDMLDRIELMRPWLFKYDFPYMPKAVEQHFEITVDGNNFMGIGDVITDDNRIIDHKFVKKKHTTRSPMQLGLYSMGFPEVIEGAYEEVYISRGKLAVNMIPVTPSDLQAGKVMVFSILNLIKEATRTNVFPHHYGWACKQCPFKEQCAVEVAAGEPVVYKSY